MAKKNLGNIKSSVISSRLEQSKKRAIDTVSTSKADDLVNNKYEGLYAKGLQHNADGTPDSLSVEKLSSALESGEQADFDALTRGGARKLANPQAALGFELSGADPEGVTMPVSPTLDSRESAAEMMEVYEKNILRDIPFHTISGTSANADLDRAIATLNAFGDDFKGPKVGGVVTRKSLFRGAAPGDLVGPYISQLMHLDVNIGNHTITQKGPSKTGSYGITETNFLEIQKGNVPVSQTIDATKVHIFSPRQLGSFVHIDFVYQAHLYAAAILASNGAAGQSGFVSQTNEGRFVDNGGVAEIASVVGEISRHALRAAWVQKWRKNMRLRPEAMAGRIAKIEDGDLAASLVHADVFTYGANTISAVKAYNVSEGGESKAWLPLQFAEGSPTHPSYPAGHAAIAGACSTILKIYFADAAWSTLGLGAVESLDGSQLDTYTGADAGDMTIHGELNKLASNMSIGRNMAGVHYRKDGDEGMILGEAVAVQYFKDIKETYNVNIGEISFVGFGGNTITI
jgi:membrane-associated phospholipid phosphatase